MIYQWVQIGVEVLHTPQNLLFLPAKILIRFYPPIGLESDLQPLPIYLNAEIQSQTVVRKLVPYRAQ